MREQGVLATINPPGMPAMCRMLMSTLLIADSQALNESGNQPAGEIKTTQQTPQSKPAKQVSVFPVRRGQFLELDDESTGTFQSKQWRFRRVGDLPNVDPGEKKDPSFEPEWMTLDSSEQTLQIPEEGLYELELSVLPYAGRGRDPATGSGGCQSRRFPTRNVVLGNGLLPLCLHSLPSWVAISLHSETAPRGGRFVAALKKSRANEAIPN